MKTTLSILALTTALFLTGCETYTTQHRPGYRSGYSNQRYSSNSDYYRGQTYSRTSYPRGYSDNNYGRRNVVVVGSPRVTGRTGVVVSSSRPTRSYYR